MTTGAPATSIMKMVRFDHSISPSDRSKMRSPEAMKPGAAGIARTGWGSWAIGGLPLNSIQSPRENRRREKGGEHKLVLRSPFSCLPLASESCHFTRYWKTA